MPRRRTPEQTQAGQEEIADAAVDDAILPRPAEPPEGGTSSSNPRLACTGLDAPHAGGMLTFDDPLLVARRHRLEAELAESLGGALLLVHAGTPIPLPENTDRTYPFRAHSEYFYLTGLECPGAVVAYDPSDRSGEKWHTFVPALTEGEAVWEGRSQVPGELLDGLESWISARNRPQVHLGAPPLSRPHAGDDERRAHRVREHFRHARRPKDARELALLRKAAACTEAGFLAVRTRLRSTDDSQSERGLQIALETAFFEEGAHRTGYGSIVGSGPNAAVLHFDPSARRIREGEFVLVDAGAEVDRYVCDVTRTFVAGGKPTPFQRDLHRLVVAVEEAAIASCRPGVEWKDLHLRSALELTAGLVDLGILRGNAESLVEQDAHTLFYPHGLGHLVGLGVRDASGTLPGRTKDPRPSLKTLRTDLPLRPGYVITVEPGVYFIPTLLNDPVRRERYRESVNWPVVEALLELGGVRIEDNVLITEGDPEVLTAAIPKAW